MPFDRRIRSGGGLLAMAALVTLAFTGCVAPIDDIESTSPAPSAPEPTEAAPTPTPTPLPIVDPADVASWTITAAALGPIERGAPYQDAVAGLPFEVTEWCEGVVRLSPDGVTQIVLDLSDDGTLIDAAWVMAQAADVTASPSTEAGIRIGSSTAELTAAYPDLQTLVQRGPDTWVYAVPESTNAWVDFIVHEDLVVLIGTSSEARVPKEWCT